MYFDSIRKGLEKVVTKTKKGKQRYVIIPPISLTFITRLWEDVLYFHKFAQQWDQLLMNSANFSPVLDFCQQKFGPNPIN